MKLLHLGDLHIGRSLGEFDLIEDQRYILEQILRIAKQERVEAILIAGDIYDKSVPSEAAVRLFDEFLCHASELGYKVFAISGNHDSDERMNFGSSLLRASNVFISAKYEGDLFHHTLEDEYGRVTIYLLPFIKASQVRHFHPSAQIMTYEDAVREALGTVNLDPTARNILVAHQFVVGEQTGPTLGGSESAAVRRVGLVERVGFGCFGGFDYTALGHIHSSQAVGREEIRYAGSPLKYSLSEAESQKTVTIITLYEKGRVEIEQRPLRPMRDLRHLKGRMDQLLTRESISDTEDFIYATLTDEYPIDNVMGVFQQYYPNTVRIEYDNSHTKELEDEIVVDIEQKPFQELFSDFYQMIYGCKMESEEMELFRKMAGEVGILHETD